MKKYIFYALSLLISSAVIYSCSSAQYEEGDERLAKIKQSPHFKDGHFYNPNRREVNSIPFFSMIEVMDSLYSRTPEYYASPYPDMQADLSYFTSEGSDQLNVTWIGHSTLLINIDGYRIITDPLLEESFSVMGDERINGEVPLEPDSLPKVDAVIISHNHYDHLQHYSVRKLNELTDHFIVPLGVGAELEEWGVPRSKITELDWWEEYNYSSNLMIAAVPAQHFSGRGIYDRDASLWAAWVIKGPNHKIYFSGDTGYFEEFKNVGKKYGPFDMTFLDVGAYNKLWHVNHLFPEEAVQAHLELRGEILHPIHWGTYQRAFLPIFEPIKRLTKAADSLGVKVATPILGETTVYDTYIPNDRWWENLIVLE